MREVHWERISKAVAELFKKINYYLNEDVYNALKKSLEIEESPVGKRVLCQLLENAEIAAEERIPLCQDTGIAVVFISLGQEVIIKGKNLEDAVNIGVAEGYSEGYLRKSVVRDPIKRINTGNNTPAIIHTEIIPGDKIKITVSAKGGGSENMSAMSMLSPAAGSEGIIDFVLETVKRAGPNPCPPIIVGVGVGGNFELAPLLAKKALLRPLNEKNEDEFWRNMEDILLQKINSLGIGPQGFGGRITALKVSIETFPCHIASLPVAVNIDCHCHRHWTIEI
ncbi:MAG TPA: fumarate hydratase [Peptococcaceae bacterium]|nr:MAG: Hydro-lyase, Fe-S type, tartrate/fumarate subfamily, alpha subunit [Clostridia bacterium 41_269]HBT19989.1 fumarate hydratase [Peptococcaceae bacterium]